MVKTYLLALGIMLFSNYAFSQSDPKNYNVLYFCDRVFGTDQMLAALNSLPENWQYTIAENKKDFENELVYGSYDLAILFLQNGPASLYDTAIQTFSSYIINKHGKGIFYDGSASVYHANMLGFNYTGNKNDTYVNYQGTYNIKNVAKQIKLTNTEWIAFSNQLKISSTCRKIAEFSSGYPAMLSVLNDQLLVYGFANDVVPSPEIFREGIMLNLSYGPQDIKTCGINNSATLVGDIDSAKMYSWHIIDEEGYQTNVKEGGIYSGTNTNTLNISNIDTLYKYKFYCLGYWVTGQAVSRTASFFGDKIAPMWHLHDTSLYSCNGINAEISFPIPIDDCEIDSISHNSPYGISKTDPSGLYPIGQTQIRYYVRDISGNSIVDSFQVFVFPDNTPPVWIEKKPSTTYTGTTENKPDFIQLSQGTLSGNPYYDGDCCEKGHPPVDIVDFVPSLDGVHTISTDAGFDTYLLLYTDPLNFRMNPPTAFVGGNDDIRINDSLSRLSVTLNAGKHYYLCVTGYSDNDFGKYKLDFSLPVKTLHDTLFFETCENSAFVTFPEPVDFCGIEEMYFNTPYGNNLTNPDGNYPFGNTKIHYYMKDIAGNEVRDSIILSLIKDKTPPIWSISDTTAIACSGNTYIHFPLPQDACGIETIWHDSPYAVSTSDISGNYPKGKTVVHFSVTDNYKNILNDSIEINVIDDNIAPEIVCSPNFVANGSKKDKAYTVIGTELDPAVTEKCQFTLINDFDSTESLAGAKIPYGNTSIKWKVTDLMGNSDSCSINIIIHQPNFTSQLEDDNISIYPNPTDGKLNLSLPGSGNLFVMDISGKIIFEKQVFDGENEFDFTSDLYGIYIFKIVLSNQIYIQKIIFE